MRHRIIEILLVFLLFLRLFFYFTNPETLPSGNVIISGSVMSEPVIFENAQQVILENYKVYVPLYPSISYGDFLVVEGEASDGVIKKGEVKDLRESTSAIHQFRRNLLGFYKSVLPSDEAALIAGATIGSKQLLRSDFWESLTSTGTAHVVVASGMNVTIISKFLLDLLLLIMPRRKAVPLAFAGVWLYAGLSGFGAPIIRASIMGSITFAAQEFGKLNQAIRALYLTTWGMLMFKPEWIVDTSFLLTFAATGAILVLSKPIEQKFNRVPTIIKNDLATSMAASVGVAPILWWNFGQVNLLSPFINAIVLWTIAPLTLMGGLGGIVGLLFAPFGQLLLYLIYPLAWWFTKVILLFS